jgi:hypothetical protein
MIIKILLQITITKITGSHFGVNFLNLSIPKSKLISKENYKNTTPFWPEKFIRYIVP